MTAKKTSSFRGKVGANAQKTAKAGTSYGHLNLPKGVGVFNPDPDGRYKLDFLPYKVTDTKHPDKDEESGVALVGDLWWKRPYKLHRNVGASNDSAVCLTSIGKKCPICEYRTKRMKDGAEKEETDAMKASTRILYIVVPLDSKKHEDKIHIFDISQWNFQNLLGEELKENEDNEVFPDIEEGLTLKVRFEGATMGNSKPFPQASRIDFLEREETYTESILDEIPNLDEVLKILSYKELDDKFLEMEDDDGGKLKDVDEDETPKTARTKKSLRAPKEEKKEKDEDETPKTDLTWRHLEIKSKRGLVRLIDDEKLKVDPADYEDDDALRGAIADELGIEKPEEKKQASKQSEKSEKKESSGKCPHKHTFAEDFEKFDGCADCTTWDDCYDANKKL